MWENVKSESGVVMVIAALMLVVLLGATAVAIDTGHLYLVRSQLQKTADAAALAGAQTFVMNGNQGIAEYTGYKYVMSNFPSGCRSEIVSNAGTGQVQVNLSQVVKLWFAPILGFTKTTVSVNATAGSSTIVRTKNIVPFGVLEQNFEYGQQYILKYGAEKGASLFSGNYGALALGGNGASRYRENIKIGYQGEITVGDQVMTETGNMAGPTDDGVSFRKSLCTHGCNYATQIEANCPRVVITPVIDQLPNGRGETTVKGFAAFFLEETVDSESPGQKNVVGRFLRWAATGETGEDGNNFGLYSIRLIK